ncbi:nucleotidyltransferase domain-containing protein [Candidatus Nanohalobium constans]|uniref:Nucleotidyltransferase domain protein n=1 Tax=Candidatus Nanohalobium constans TaxID=2565781 RepID=A0A5Q0UID3_9ARCH|nr:nucleotidyltransferase domain-containing protein [Candidatus Nanohalobium constans]QGA80695.1 nucleotidyltransferase domain protein [Candidatus Nanohalobium constans]
MSSKDKMKEMREKSQERRMDSAQEFSDKLLDKLGDKVKVVAVWGSVAKGEHGHDSDIDTLVVLDDTKLQKDVPEDAKKKIRKKVTDLAKETDDRITIQYFPFLTEFWDSLRKGEPLAIEAVRNGSPVYDTGIFMPAKRLLERGKISGTQESVKKRLKLGAAGYKKAEKTMKSSLPHKLEQAMANAGQAPIMLSGANPPPKEKVPEKLEEMFVEQDMLEQEYVDMAQEIYDFGDKGEKNPEEVTGEELDEMMEKTDDYVRRMHKLVSQMGAKKKVRGLVDDYKKFLKANVAALRAQDVEPPEDKDDLPQVVEQNLDVDEEHLEMFDRWEKVVEKVKEKEMDDLEDKEIYELKNETREFVKKVGKEYQEMKEEKTEEAEKMAPDMDTTSVAKAADTEEMVPNLQEKAEKEVESEEDSEEEEK